MEISKENHLSTGKLSMAMFDDQRDPKVKTSFRTCAPARDQAFRPALTKKILPRLGREWKAWNGSVFGSCLLGHRREGRNYRWKLKNIPYISYMQKPWIRHVDPSLWSLRHSQSIVTHLPSIYTRLSILGPHVPSTLEGPATVGWASHGAKMLMGICYIYHINIHQMMMTYRCI